jgi:hypothetical protein
VRNILARDAQYAVQDIRTEGYIRGLYECKKAKKINADINAALNIARKLGYRIRIARKIESYHVTHKGVKPLIPRKGLTHETRQEKTPPFRAGRRHYYAQIL